MTARSGLRHGPMIAASNAAKLRPNAEGHHRRLPPLVPQAARLSRVSWGLWLLVADSSRPRAEGRQ
jgi:hypothetical protein